jgi:hypothetical protein
MKMGFAVLLSIFVTCCNTQTARTEPSATIPLTTHRPFITTPPTVTPDPKVALRESLMQVLGMGNGEIPRLRKISYSKPEAGDITITWTIDETVPQNSRKAAAQMDATNILKALQDNKARFIYVVLIGIFSIQDKHGNTTEIPVMDLGFNKSRLDKVNWEDFQPSDIYDLADIADVAEEWK